MRCRSAVDRDGYRREIELIPDAELPARLSCVLSQLHAGMRVVGLDSASAWQVVVKCAFDSMPQIRRRVFDLLRKADGQLDTTAIATSVGYPTSTAHRACEDLAAHTVVSRQSGGKGKADRWCLTDESRELYRAATSSEISGEGKEAGSSEMSGGGGFFL